MYPPNELNIDPTRSMYGIGIFTYIWFMFMANVGKYTMHGSYGHRYVNNMNGAKKRRQVSAFQWPQVGEKKQRNFQQKEVQQKQHLGEGRSVIYATYTSKSW